MDDPRDATDPTAQRRLQIQRRAKRGLVAGYIHSLSVRHGADPRPRVTRFGGTDRMLEADCGEVLETGA